MNSTKLLGAASIAVLVGLAGCASNDKANMSSTAPTPPPPALSAQDTSFVNSVAQSGTEEINAAQLAETNSHSARVKSYAQQMVSDHTAANQKLASIAQAKGVTPSMTPDDAHTQMMSQLQGEHGRAFDRAYIQGQISDHQAIVQVMQNEIQSGTDPELKDFASTTLPVIQHHLQMAEALQAPAAGSRSMHHRYHHHHVSTAS